MKRQGKGGISIGIVFIFIATAFAGCVSNAPTPDLVSDQLSGVPSTAPTGTTVHKATGALDTSATVTTGPSTDVLTELILAKGIARIVPAPVAEPTIGVTKSGAVFMSAQGGGPRIMRTIDTGLTWKDVSPKLPTGHTEPPVTNDPYVYVDPATDRVYSIDLLGTVCDYLRWSDDEGKTWERNPAGCGLPPGVHDHQTIVAAKPRTVTTSGYASVLYYCINQVYRSSCATSLDGGVTWGPLVTVWLGYQAEDAEIDASDPPNGALNGALNGLCGGLHGHLKAAPDGTVYLPKGQCGVPQVAVTKDDGKTWTIHTVSEKVPIAGHELNLAVDEAGNLYALWEGNDDALAYFAHSSDQGATWSDPIIVGAPQVKGLSYATIAAGSAGRIAFAYIGSEQDDPYNLTGERTQDEMQKVAWYAYMGLSTNALDSQPTIVTVTLHEPGDPVARGGANCGRGVRCGGNTDFIDIVIDTGGRPWSSISDNCYENCTAPDATQNSQGSRGFAGTLLTGPKLRGEMGVLVELVADLPKQQEQ
ncbi:MAG: exo-alpha-sialidase [Euryarchaeota archaeon]|nr:exo-alpha-sialidase [Euryarchaeota archaeon]